MKNTPLALLLFFVSLLPACQKQLRSKSELMAYVRDPQNGLQKTMEVNNIKVSVTSKPWQLFLKDSLMRYTNKQEPKNYNNRYYFVLSLSHEKKELLRQLDFNTYSTMVQMLSFRMQPLIRLIPDEGEPLVPMDCIFQQTYGMSSSNELLIVFDRKTIDQAKEMTIVIREFGLNLGTLKFKFNMNDFNKIPLITT